MTKDVSAKLKERKAILEKEFSMLNNEQEQLVWQGKVLNKRLSEIRARQLQLQWSFTEVKELSKISKEEKEEKKEEKVEEKVEKKK